MTAKFKQPKKCITCKKHIRSYSQTGYCHSCYKLHLNKTRRCKTPSCKKYVKKGEETYKDGKLLCKNCFSKLHWKDKQQRYQEKRDNRGQHTGIKSKEWLIRLNGKKPLRSSENAKQQHPSKE